MTPPPDWRPGATEADSDRDGLLSTRPEVHSLVIGLYTGATRANPWVTSNRLGEMRERYDDVDAEPWYFMGGYLLGTVAQVGLLLLFLRLGFPAGVPMAP